MIKGASTRACVWARKYYNYKLQTVDLIVTVIPVYYGRGELTSEYSVNWVRVRVRVPVRVRVRVRPLVRKRTTLLLYALIIIKYLNKRTTREGGPDLASRARV